MTEHPFEDDTRNPFMPGDEMPKPKPGDLLIIRKTLEVSSMMPDVLRVVYVHDTLAESWDPSGEAAWQQHDVNDIVGFKGHWYAVCEDPRHEDEEWSVASYEVMAVEHTKED